MKTSERFALNQWLCDYPENMTYDEILELMQGDDEHWTHEQITKWEIVENLTMRQVIELIDDTRRAFEWTIKTMGASNYDWGAKSMKEANHDC